MYSQKLMDRAINHAIKNPIQSRGRTSISRMAAVLVSDRYNIQYVGINSYKTHPLVKKFSKSEEKLCLHAELDALIQVCRRWDESYEDVFSYYDIYVARVLKDNSPALAKPCSCCLGALTYFGIRNIYHT